MESATVDEYWAKPIQGVMRSGFVWTHGQDENQREYLASDAVKVDFTHQANEVASVSWRFVDAPPITYDWQWVGITTSRNDDYESPDDWDDLSESIQDAIISLESDGLIGEVNHTIITNEQYYHIDHNGSFNHTIVDTEKHKFDEFSCGYDSETKTLCVRVYEYENEDEQRYDLPPAIECKACGRSNSTFGLIGKEIVCDCGHRNRVI